MNDKLITPSEISDYISAEKKRMSPEDLQAMVVSIKADKYSKMGLLLTLSKLYANQKPLESIILLKIMENN